MSMFRTGCVALYSQDQSNEGSVMTNRLHPIGLIAPLDPGVLDDRSALRSIRTRLERIGQRRLLIVLDLAAILVVAATFAQLGAPELLFHVVFVILTVEAFIFGRRICLQRLAVVSVALLYYASLPLNGAKVQPLDLTEWPLMFAIAVLVAWMADREQSVGRRYAGLYRETRDRLVRAQEEERGRIARDLHDGIGQTLTALTLTLDAAASGDPAATAPAIARSRELARDALADTRLAAERIRPPRLAERGLASALRAMSSPAGGPVQVTIGPGSEVRIPAEAEVDAYRIAEEAVRNAIQHASASGIRVALTRMSNGLRLEVADDGAGFDRSTVDPRRLGIVGMGERAAAIGADLEVDSAIGRGTRVRLTIPANLLEPVGPHT
jgi:signal transduction histidine kinase